MTGRGGIVWHTQGSGKSLTMVFLVRAMRSDPRLVRFKVVVVTDRTDLQDQLGRTAGLTGESVLTAASVVKLTELLSTPGKALVFAMIQKYRNPKARKADNASLGVLDLSEDEPGDRAAPARGAAARPGRQGVRGDRGGARRRYRDGIGFDASLYGAKVRKLIDDHVDALGIEQKIPPVSITEAEFDVKVGELRTDRAKASEMEHAIRYHLRENFDTDPGHYERLSRRLEEILEEIGEQWDQLALALAGFLPEVRAGRQADGSGLDPATEAPFYDLLKRELAARTRAAGMPERMRIGGLDFAVRASARRRSAGITVNRDGSLLLHAPAGADPAALAAWAGSKRAWVLRKLAEKDLLLSTAPGREFVTGEGFDYLGRHYRLQLTDGPPGSAVKLDRGRLHLPRALAETGGGAAAMIGWYRQRDRTWLPRHIAPWATRIGLHPGDLDVRDLGYRWGSLGRGDRLNIHWATMQLPVSLVDYVIVHELAHIGQPRHTPAFWATVARPARPRPAPRPPRHRRHHPVARLTSAVADAVSAVASYLIGLIVAEFSLSCVHRIGKLLHGVKPEQDVVQSRQAQGRGPPLLGMTLEPGTESFELRAVVIEFRIYLLPGVALVWALV